ncbi:MBL fold metallo-hydrolase [Paracoccus lutimaris]|uniref:Glyoxylase-like metal-dependent hydrolase (Beta-lactamase superfamily II) n=1 Tax=Paracoccus lutimaris TaxID=1490030 RepID=A0A368YY01_9RHOB|nr:MBL fold metallo-hydrolase [Paracoccus lutimaris]RCW83847.1 glyoxylase-like metal-dependent hydrolase (beta-lactamase superfamily II) [Paracoccus lutimaris]
MSDIDVTRRTALLLGGLPVLLALPAHAQTAPAAPAFSGRAQTIRLGAFEVTTLLGGESMREKPIETFGIGADPAEFDRLSAENFIPADRTGSSFTLTLVKTSDALVLFDTGMIADNNKASLAAAGYTPEDVTHIVLTHMHPDHISGLMAGTVPNFPNAELIFPKMENDFWAANPSEAYTANVAPLAAKARQIADGDEIMPGIRAEGAYGHTPGHTTYLLESDGQKLLITGDTFNHYAYSVQRPGWHVRFDQDKEAGAATRARVLARLAGERIPCIGYHMPYPALAFIAPNGEGSFRFVPATYQFAG